MKKGKSKKSSLEMMSLKGVGLKDLSLPKTLKLSEINKQVNKTLKNVDAPAVARQSALLIGAVATGAALAYFLDPDSGKKRRDAITQKFTGLGEGALDSTSVQFNALSGRVREVVAQGMSFIRDNFMGEEAATEPNDDIVEDTADGRYSTAARKTPVNDRDFENRDTLN